MSLHVPEDRRFHVVVSDQFLDEHGRLSMGDIGLHLLEDAPHVSWEYAALDGDAVTRANAALVMGERIDVAWLARAPELRVIARFGVGLNAIDLAACTAAGIAVTTTPDGVRAPVASAAMTLVLALAHRLVDKRRLARNGDWQVRSAQMGTGIAGRTLGLLGFGNIGREIARLAGAFSMTIIAADPYADSKDAETLGVALVDRNTLFARSDYAVITCPLTPETHHIVGERELTLLGPDGYLVNVARGAIVDESALVDALRQKCIAGAGLDVFESEPLDPANPLLSLANVIATPHSLAITGEMAMGNGVQAVRSILAVAQGERPDHVANPDVLNPTHTG